jgi:2'-5' RNA ligase
VVDSGPAKLRLFFALWPAAEVRQRIITDTERAISATGASPVPPANYHITLAFLGAVSASSLADIIRICGDIRFRRFLLTLDRTGYWPRSRIAWLAPSHCPLELEALVDDIWNKLAELGFRQELRPYQPHVSLCREVSGGLGMRLDTPINWPVSSFVLVQSTPGETGPVYTVLEQFAAGD